MKKTNDGLLIFYIASQFIVSILYSIGIGLVFIFITQYSFPTSFDGYGPYAGLFDRPAEDIQDYTDFTNNTDTKIQVRSMIILGWVFEDGAGIFWWLINSESLRIFVIVIVGTFAPCLFQKSELGVTGIILMGVVIFVDFGRIAFYSIAWGSNWIFVITPGDTMEVTPQFLGIFFLSIIFLLFDLILLFFMVLSVGRAKKLEREPEYRLTGSRIGSRINSRINSRTYSKIYSKIGKNGKKKKKKKTKKKKKKTKKKKKKKKKKK